MFPVSSSPYTTIALIVLLSHIRSLYGSADLIRDSLDNIQNIGFDYDYEEVNEVFLKAMFDARWFPYAGWIADYRIVDAMLEILDTSRASKNRVKRIDKLIFSYYDKEEINNLKRGWRQMNLPPYKRKKSHTA